MKERLAAALAVGEEHATTPAMSSKAPTIRDLFGMRCLRCGERATHRLKARGASTLFCCSDAACLKTAEVRLRACIGPRVYQQTFSADGFSQWGHRKVPR